MNRIQLVRKIPVDMDDAQIDDLQCKALDLCRSVLEFLDLSIRTLKNSFASIRWYLFVLLISCRELGERGLHWIQGVQRCEDEYWKHGRPIQFDSQRSGTSSKLGDLDESSTSRKGAWRTCCQYPWYSPQIGYQANELGFTHRAT